MNVAGRLGHAAATVVVVYVVSFLLLQALPGDPLERLDSPALTAEDARRNRVALGLDRPLPARLGATTLSYLRGDLGVSFERHRPVARVLADALPATALLGAAALALAYGLGVPIAIAAWRVGPKGRVWVDRAALLFTVTPRFWFGVLLILVFHGWVGWLPASHAAPVGGGTWLDRLRHLVLPAVTLGLPAAAAIARFQLAMMEREMPRLHVVAARARGGAGWPLVFRSLVRPTLMPTIALLGLDLKVLASGALVVELVFAWPGLGRLAAEAVLSTDYPLALAAAVLSAIVVVLGRLLAETIASRMDPRSAGPRKEP